MAEVILSVERPIANVRGFGPEQVEYAGSAERLRDLRRRVGHEGELRLLLGAACQSRRNESEAKEN